MRGLSLLACAGMAAALLHPSAPAAEAPVPGTVNAGAAGSGVERGRFGVGLNYPGLGVRALVGDDWIVEARGQYETTAQVAGGRLYYCVLPSGRLYPYVGLEADYVMFQDDVVDAGGFAAEAFAGLEYFVWERISLEFDFGPAYVGLSGGGMSAGGIRFVVNFGLTYYF